MLNYEYPPIGSGSGIITQYISEGLARLGNRVTVVTTAFSTEGEVSGNLSENQESSGPQNRVEVIRVKARRKNTYYSDPVEMLSWIHATKDYIRQYQNIHEFNFCFAHFALPGGEVARWLKRKFNIPYVIMSHGHDIPWVHPRKMFLFHLFLYPRIHQICSGSTINFIQTRTMKSNLDRFLGTGYSEKNRIIPNGIDAEHFYPNYGQRPARLKILFVGRLVSQKDPLTFLKALALFSKEYPDLLVEIFGDGPLHKKMQTFCARHNLDNIVKFMGKQSEDAMVRAYQSSHLLVATSLNEGMSISLLEALACGTYVITTPVSGTDIVIKEQINGTFVKFRDSRDVSCAMSEFAITKFKNKYVAPDEVIDQIGRDLSWEKICLEYQACLENFFR